MEEKRKRKPKKFLSVLSKVGVGFLTFAGALVGMYLLTPNRVRQISTNFTNDVVTEQGNFEKFVERLTRDAGVSSGDEEVPTSTATYLSMEFEDLAISYKVENSEKVNTVAIDGGLDFRMHGLSANDIELNLQADVNYNGKRVSVGLGHFKDVLYLNFNDTLRLKTSFINNSEIVDEFLLLFASEGHLNLPQMFDDFADFLTEQLNNVVDGLLSGGAGSGLDLGGFSTSEVQTDAGWKFTLSVGENIIVNLLSDQDFALKRVELEKIAINDLTVSGAINVSNKEYKDFIVPINENYHEILNYSGIYSKLAHLLSEDNQSLGVEFSADLDNVVSNKTTDVALVKGSINIDFDKLLDFEKYVLVEEEENPEESAVGNRSKDNNADEQEEESTSFINTFINDCAFNLQLDLIGQNEKEYANLDLSFIDGEGYIRFNEQTDEETKEKTSVMKLKIDTETMNWILSELPDTISSLSGDNSEDSLAKLLDFLSDDLASAISDGDYSFIIDMIKEVSNTEDSFKIDIDLSSLGIGDNAGVTLVVDGTENKPAVKIGVTDLSFGDYSLDVKANTSEFNEVDMGVLDNYQPVKFLPDVIDQVTNIVKTPKSGFVINGSVLDDDANAAGIKFYGAGKFDNSEDVKAGFGNMVIEQYKYRSTELWATHYLNVDVQNLAKNISTTVDAVSGKTVKNNQNEALFIYGQPDSNNVKGKLHLQTFVDLVDIFTTFYGEAKDQEKFTKFLAPITKLLGVSELGNIIGEKDFLHLASNELLQKVSIFDGEDGKGIEVTIGGVLFGLDSDMTIKVNFEKDKYSIKSIDLVDFKFGGKNINVTIELEDYDFTTYTDYKGVTRTLVNEIENHRNDSYMNLDGIKTLLNLGINTTKMNYYHLTADAGIHTILSIDIDLSGIDFYVYVDGVTVKVYGKISSVPLIIAVSEDYTLLKEKKMSAEFSFETYDNNQDDKVGGIFNIKRIVTEPKTEIGWFTIKHYNQITTYHYQCDSQNFLENIVTYLLVDMLGVKSSLADQITGSDDSSSETAASDYTKTFTSTGFNASGNTIKLGLNLDVLTGVSALRELELTIVGGSVDTSEGSMDILKSLSATLRVHYAVDINISLTARVQDCKLDETEAKNEWNAKVASAFASMTNVTLPSTNFNKPLNPKITTQKIYTD